MLIFQCRHDVNWSYDVMTFNDPASGWQRTVRPNGKVVKWRQVRLFWEDADVDYDKRWVWEADDASGSGSEVCHFEQRINKHN